MRSAICRLVRPSAEEVFAFLIGEPGDALVFCGRLAQPLQDSRAQFPGRAVTHRQPRGRTGRRDGALICLSRYPAGAPPRSRRGAPRRRQRREINIDSRRRPSGRRDRPPPRFRRAGACPRAPRRAGSGGNPCHPSAGRGRPRRRPEVCLRFGNSRTLPAYDLRDRRAETRDRHRRNGSGPRRALFQLTLPVFGAHVTLDVAHGRGCASSSRSARRYGGSRQPARCRPAGVSRSASPFCSSDNGTATVVPASLRGARPHACWRTPREDPSDGRADDDPTLSTSTTPSHTTCR